MCEKYLVVDYFYPIFVYFLVNFILFYWNRAEPTGKVAIFYLHPNEEDVNEAIKVKKDNFADLLQLQSQVSQISKTQVTFGTPLMAF